ncbi:peroxisomal acyl-coenzyme A oxidase 1 [Prunus yedoensis var. nudiflora]|uniref:Acyl-coenzyme A oxidase n=1 Tax=Prunus yedoensis var. nudiflora TaxID=2094558 RepID=A0A314Y2J0_PRUYE|nr:peroxisomal acyl-coenzyme A oxidase 1 [Prunus yedoensis var. nudiflora]
MDGSDHLAHERSKAQFDVEKMKIFWAGSLYAFQVSNRIACLVAGDPAFRKENRAVLSRKELFKSTLRKAAHAWKRITELGLSEEEASWLRFYVDELSYAYVHWGMFVPAIKGSGLETTANFDPKTDEFIIHSPTLTSSKWWPGGLGKIATHAVVYARLITDGQDHGVHGFIVQLRSLGDHLPLPGITVGDIGMKFGSGAFNSMDNGFVRFDHVHIPRSQMLMRVSQVTKEGKYVHSNVPRQLVYGAMVYVRQVIVVDASIALSRAVCIAARYSSVRRQFGSQINEISGTGVETQVIDYKTQQSRLFPLLASAYAFRVIGEWLKWLYTDLTQKLEANDFSTLPEAHACTAGLKSLTTSAAADGIEECRKLCGGHGYLSSSGLPELYAVFVPACTYEGDNIVLLLQVARFLMKTISELPSGRNYKLAGTTAYMGDMEHYLIKYCCNVQKTEDWLKPNAILEAFEARAIRMCFSCAQNLTKFADQSEGFSELSTDLVEAAIAHCQLIVVSKFIEKLQQNIEGNGVKQQLETLCYIYALHLIHKNSGDFLSTGSLNPKQASLANDQLRSLYAKWRPNVIALVDAFNYSDHFLGSVLGCYDGNVYPKLYEEACKDPLNDSVVADGYGEYIQPLLNQQS